MMIMEVLIVDLMVYVEKEVEWVENEFVEVDIFDVV